MIMVHMQWHDSADRDAEYKNIRLVANGPGSFSLSKLGFKEGFAWLQNVVLQDSIRGNESGDLDKRSKA